jgi:hypothetical protein
MESVAKEYRPLFKEAVLKSPTVLWSMLATEMANRCCTSATIDIQTVNGRVEHEGISFLTISLPAFGKDFQKSLDQGLVSRNAFQGFSWRAGLPRFLGGFLDLVFDRDSGVLIDKPDVEAIIAIRQLTLMFGKIHLPCSDARVAGAMSDYVDCDREVKENDEILDRSDFSEFKRMSSLLFRGVFSKIDRLIYEENVVPRHGPGATADKLLGNKKFLQSTWTDRLQKVFSFENFLLPSARFATEDGVTFLEPGEEMPVKVISVPKTLKTPRIIAIEPTVMQYMQQSILEQLVPALETDKYLSQFLGFSDQVPNQELAKLGSEDGSVATLDLSEASDRVSFLLVREMLSDFPSLLAGIEATRSTKADVPGHGIIPLHKYASMGSALCFPVEAMVFLTMTFLGIERELNTRFSKRGDLLPFLGRVRIYGDDIICPVDSVHSVIASLEHFGARVGADKSFWIGRFRESCGKEYYEGHDVSIVKFRRMLPNSLRDVPECISLVETRNQFYLAGAWSFVSMLDDLIRKVFKYFPVVESSSSVLGRTSFLGYRPERMCDVLHRPLVKGYVPRAVIPKNSLTGHGALLKFFLKRGGLPSVDGKHLERSGRPRAVDIKPRWSTPY